MTARPEHDGQAPGAAAAAGAGGKTPPAPLPVELRIAIMRTSRRLRTEASGDAVSPGQYSVLAAILLAPMTLRQLADREHMQAPSMTRIVNALEQNGLVVRRDHPTDGRQVLVELTELGRQTIIEARNRRTEWMARKLAELSAEERAVLKSAAAILQRMSAK
jgi:DNA-binding MarR family transcriptional regulator